DVGALQRDAAPSRGVAMDDEQPAAGAGCRRLARAPLDDDRAGHDVLGDPDATVALDPDRGELVHAGAVVADVTVDLDLVGGVEPNDDAVLAARVEHPHPADRIGQMQTAVELADAVGRQVERELSPGQYLGRRHQATPTVPQLYTRP